MRPLPFLPVLLSVGLSLAGCGGFTHADRSASLTVANLSDAFLCAVHLDPTHRGPSGKNRLPDGKRLGPEMQRTFFLPAGRWDLRIDDCEERTVFARRGLRIEGAQRIVFKPVEVQRVPGRSTRRYARTDPPAHLPLHAITGRPGL